MVQLNNYANTGLQSEESTYDELPPLGDLNSEPAPLSLQRSPLDAEARALLGLPRLPLRLSDRLKHLSTAASRALPYIGSNPRRRSSYAYTCALPFLQVFQQTVICHAVMRANSQRPRAFEELVRFLSLALNEVHKLPTFDDEPNNKIRSDVVRKLGQLLSEAAAREVARGGTPHLGHLGNLLWWQSKFPGLGPLLD